MAFPAYDPEQIDALARVLAEAALDQLIREMELQVRPGEQGDEQQRPATGVSGGAT